MPAGVVFTGSNWNGGDRGGKGDDGAESRRRREGEGHVIGFEMPLSIFGDGVGCWGGDGGDGGQRADDDVEKCSGRR